MSSMLRLAALYGVATASLVVQRVVRRLCLYLVVGLLGGIGLGFLTAAGFTALSNVLGSVSAAIIVGSAYLLTAVIALVAARSARQ